MNRDEAHFSTEAAILFSDGTILANLDMLFSGSLTTKWYHKTCFFILFSDCPV